MRPAHASGRGSARIPVTLACSECKARNYKTTKSPGGEATGGEKPLEIKKFCKQCQHHTLHRETK